MISNGSVFRFKHGDHTCIFYRNHEDLFEILVPYLLEGLQQGEKCFCAQVPPIAKKLEAALEHVGVNVAREKKRGAIEILSDRETYFSHGTFEPSRMIELLEHSITKALRDGFNGFRSAGELRWAATGICHCDQLVEYERLVEDLFPQRPAIGLCQYPISAFDTETLRCVLEAHRIAVSETMMRARHSSFYVRHGGFAADIVADRLNPSSRFYYVVQPHGAADIVGWGFEDSFEAAMKSSESTIADLDQRRVAVSHPTSN
jgi:MEDS: MEthanogen/methylotroph, DcmR Sensory domain